MLISSGFHTKTALNSIYISPHLQSRGVNLVELIEVTIDDGVFWETILRSGGHHNRSRNLLSSGCLVIDLLGKGKKEKRSRHTWINCFVIFEGIQTEVCHWSKFTELLTMFSHKIWTNLFGQMWTNVFFPN